MTLLKTIAAAALALTLAAPAAAQSQFGQFGTGGQAVLALPYIVPNPGVVSSCGAGAVVAGWSNSNAGLITSGATGTTCTYVFATPFPNQASCVFALGTTGPTIPYFSTGPSNTGFTLTWTTTTANVKINYICFGD